MTHGTESPFVRHPVILTATCCSKNDVLPIMWEKAAGYGEHAIYRCKLYICFIYLDFGGQMSEVAI